MQVTSEGLHVDNRRFISPCLEGRVGDTLTVRIPPEGPKDSVTVFDHGLPLGTAVEHISTELAEEISKTRLERTIAIDKLAKRIREKNEQTPLTNVPSTKPGANVEAISVTATPTPADGAPADSQDTLGPIPELPKDGAAS